MTINELQRLLEPYGIRPLKARGQHFLLDERVVEAMADAAKIGPRSRILEIGPGPGVLTAVLLRRGAQVTAVEIDPRFRELLQARFGPEKFTLIENDILRVPNEDMFAAPENGTAQPYAVVANLPYSVTSAVLQKFLLEAPLPTSITVMIQKEVADRIVAKPGEMNALAALVQSRATISRVKDVPAAAFFPPPRVDSAVVHLALRTPQQLKELFGDVPLARYSAITRHAFAAPRKQLRNTLKSAFVVSAGDKKPPAAALEDAFRAANIEPTARPEELSVEDWIRLCRFFG